MQSRIRPEQYNQTNMISNTVKTINSNTIINTARAIQLKQYNTNKPGGDNAYLVSNTYAKTRPPNNNQCSEGWYKKINSQVILDSIC